MLLAPLTLTGNVAVLLLHQGSPGTHRTFEARLSRLKVLELVHVRDFRLRCQELLGKHSRTTKTITPLVTWKGDFEYPMLQSPASRETGVVVCFPLLRFAAFCTTN